MKNTIIVYKTLLFTLFLTLVFTQGVQAQENSKLIPTNLKWSERMALSIIKRHPEAYQIDGQTEPKWDYVHGLVLTSFEQLYKKTNNKKYLDYVKGYADATISAVLMVLELFSSD